MAIARFYPYMLEEFVQNNFPIPAEDLPWDRSDFPHWHTFCTIHLGHAFDNHILERNAQIIGQFSEDEIKLATLQTLEAKGVVLHGNSYWD